MLGFLSNNAATIEVYTLSLHDALPISSIWQKLPLLPGVWGKLLIKSLDPATTRKLKAPKRFEPSESDIRATIVEVFVSQQAKVIEGMKATAHLELERTIMTSPALSIVAYRLMDA